MTHLRTRAGFHLPFFLFLDSLTNITAASSNKMRTSRTHGIRMQKRMSESWDLLEKERMSVFTLSPSTANSARSNCLLCTRPTGSSRLISQSGLNLTLVTSKMAPVSNTNVSSQQDRAVCRKSLMQQAWSVPCACGGARHRPGPGALEEINVTFILNLLQL